MVLLYVVIPFKIIIITKHIIINNYINLVVLQSLSHKNVSNGIECIVINVKLKRESSKMMLRALSTWKFGIVRKVI
jgi:hypothetical protein